MSNDLVVKDNEIIRACYQLTVNEQRLLLSAIAEIPKEIDEDIPFTYYQERMYEVNIQDFVKLGVHPKTAYRELREAANRLYERSITIKRFSGEIKTRWVQTIIKMDDMQYDDEFELSKDFSVLIRFSYEVLPFLINLSNNFTKYMLKDISGFSSTYAIRMYELMMQFKSTGYLKIRLSEIRSIFDLGNKYPATKDLKVRVIDTAFKEINAKSPVLANYKLLKTGKKFTHLEVSFKEKPKEGNKNPPRDPNTIDWVNGQTDNEANTKTDPIPLWQTKGLSDGQIKKIAIYTKEFVDANSSKIAPNDRRDYAPIFEDWKPLLKDPKTVTTFHLVQELLDRQRI